MAQQIIIPASTTPTRLDILNGPIPIIIPATFPASNADLVLQAVLTDITSTSTSTTSSTTSTSTTTTTRPPSTDTTIFGNVVPNLSILNDAESLELGVKFRTTQAGVIKGIRFYKTAGTTGQHIGSLWASSTSKLGSSTFVGETASGWQETLFSTPVAVAANTIYTASVYYTSGDYISRLNGLTSSVINGTLSTVVGTNGVFKYGASGFPTGSYQNSNYYVDVIFSGGGSTPPPTTTSTTTTSTTTQPSTTPTTTSTSTTTRPTTPPPAGAIEGFGAGVTGGSGSSTVYHVTNTNASGAGSLANGIGDNRTIVFDVSGTIVGSFNIGGVQNLTIDAYTVHKDITIDNNNNGDGLNIDGATNVIVRGLRFIDAGNDGLNATGDSNRVVFDHCSSYGNRDGNIDIAATGSAGKNFTVQWCIMGNNQGSGNMLITSQNVSVHHNLFIGDGSGEGAERNPYAHSNYSPVGTPPNFDFRNNLVHASGRYASGNGYGAVGNYVNNYYTSNKSGLINLCADSASCGKAYVSGNFNQPSATGGTSVATEYAIPAQYRITMTDAATAARAVLASVGPWVRNSYEQGVINSITISGGTPPPPTTTSTSTTTQPSTTPTTTSTSTTTRPPTTGYTLVYSTGYDTQNDLDPFGHGQIGNGSLSTTIKNGGAGSFKSVPANVSSGIRSEVQYDSGQTPLEGIVEYDVYYDNFFSDSGHSLQWHPSTSGGSGTGLYHKGGKLQFVTVKSGTSGTDVGASFAVSTKVWHHIKLTYKFGGSGYIRVELDGVEKVNSNVQMGDGSSPYLKVGVNMWANQTSVVYYDNLKVYKKG